jgi:hypothetical protein
MIEITVIATIDVGVVGDDGVKGRSGERLLEGTGDVKTRGLSEGKTFSFVLVWIIIVATWVVRCMYIL